MTSKAYYTQCGLRHGKTTTVCWIQGPFRVGDIISRKGETQKWRVEWRGSRSLPKEALHLDWKVGGLS